jgi:hypothetical protein
MAEKERDAQGKRYERANERRRKVERNRVIYSMWKAGSTSAEIAAYLTAQGQPLSRQRVDTIIRTEMNLAKESRLHLAEELFDGELERLTAIIRNAWAIVTSNCRSCAGRGTFEGVSGVSATETVCKTCNGDGKANHPDVRIRAMKEARAAIDQRAKMLGLYEPERFAVTHDGAVAFELPDMAHLSEDELDRALNDYSAGVEAGIRLKQMADTGRLTD